MGNVDPVFTVAIQRGVIWRHNSRGPGCKKVGKQEREGSEVCTDSFRLQITRLPLSLKAAALHSLLTLKAECLVQVREHLLLRLLKDTPELRCFVSACFLYRRAFSKLAYSDLRSVISVVFALSTSVPSVSHARSKDAARTAAKSSGYRWPGCRQDFHHQALRAPRLLPALSRNHRRGFLPQSAQLGSQDSGAAAAVGHRWCVKTNLGARLCDAVVYVCGLMQLRVENKAKITYWYDACKVQLKATRLIVILAVDSARRHFLATLQLYFYIALSADLFVIYLKVLQHSCICIIICFNRKRWSHSRDT